MRIEENHPLRQLNFEDAISIAKAEKSEKDSDVWEGNLGGGSYMEETDTRISYKNGKWFVDGAETDFKQIDLSYINLLNRRAKIDEKLRKILEKEK